MDQKAIFQYCKGLGCCDACCLRYLGIKNPTAYENSTSFANKYQAENTTAAEKSKEDKINISNKKSNVDSTESKTDNDQIENTQNTPQNILVSKDIQENISVNQSTPEKNGTLKDGSENTKDIVINGSPPCKKRKLNTCVSCLGVLQEFTWKESIDMVKEVINKKGYSCNTFACGLSAPISTMLREKAITLHLADKFSAYDHKTLTPLKEAWKWSLGCHLATHINKTLDSGAVSPLLITINIDYVDDLQNPFPYNLGRAVSPLLITINIDYVDDLQELEILKKVSPQLFEERSKQKKRFATEFTRRSVEQALEHATLLALREAGDALVCSRAWAHCVSVVCTHAPVYVCGRYIKLSRNLPQSPWILDGKRVLPSSVQEIIFGPIAKYYNLTEEESERRLKFIAAGREDVDVRCLGEGRPFAIEITDPKRDLTPEELKEACKSISNSGEVVVETLVPITKEDLALLKKGEQTKSKTYEALCIKLSHSNDDGPLDTPITVTPNDLHLINTYKDSDDVTMTILQKTPIRVLHRRPLLLRKRDILEMSAKAVPDHPELFRLSVRTSAGTYIKEWVHGEVGRTRPSLGGVVGARVDLLALDVTAVHLEWPPK